VSSERKGGVDGHAPSYAKVLDLCSEPSINIGGGKQKGRLSCEQLDRGRKKHSETLGCTKGGSRAAMGTRKGLAKSWARKWGLSWLKSLS